MGTAVRTTAVICIVLHDFPANMSVLDTTDAAKSIPAADWQLLSRLEVNAEPSNDRWRHNAPHKQKYVCVYWGEDLEEGHCYLQCMQNKLVK